MNWPTKKTVHEVERGSNLDLLLRGANGIGNRLVDALLAIATALSTTQDNSAEIKAITDKVMASRKELQDAVINADAEKET
jgi:hypothetical protein